MHCLMTQLAKSLTLASICLVLTTAVGCGGSPDSNDQHPPITAQPVADAGIDVTTQGGTVIRLDASASKQALELQGALEFQWQQTAGPAVSFLSAADTQSSQPYIAIPSVTEPSTIELALTVVQQGSTAWDRLLIEVEPCHSAEGEIFNDCLAAGFGPLTAYESDTERGELHQHYGQGDYHVQWQRVETGQEQHDQVLEVTWNANAPNNTRGTNGWFGIGAGELSAITQGMDLSAFAEGALQFDMRLVYHEQPDNPTPFIVKMECGWPCSSAEMAIPNAEHSYDWQTYTYSLARLIESGLDVTNVTFPLIIQPLWRQQEQIVTVQISNVRLSKEYTVPPPQEGCPSSGAISYTLARSANPNADEQDAYARITQAMDEAVRQYNCYTNLQRAMRVSYNPDVATADGNPNGSIRFGSRASMHHVTAMHEISHVLGVGAGPFRNLVRDGIYTGAAGTAQLRAISGIADDRIQSDGTHFWPHGLNYISEGQTQADLINHCLVVEAIVADL